MPTLRRPFGPLWKTLAVNAQESQKAGRMEIAESQYLMSVALARQSRGPLHEDLAETMINAADFLMMIGKYQKSEAYYRQALVIYEKLFGEDSLIAAMIYRVLAELYMLQDRAGEARILQARSVAILGERQAS